MFTKVSFFYDATGQFLGEEPLVLTAKDARSQRILLESGTSWNVPSLTVYRDFKTAEGDPYNDDGRPPTVLFQILHPVVSFIGRAIEVRGLESPNLWWAGKALPAYKGNKPLNLPADRQMDKHRLVRYELLKWQKVIIR